MKRCWYLSLVVLVLGRIVDHVISINPSGLARELNPFAKWAIAYFGPGPLLLVTSLVVGIPLAILCAWLAKTALVYLFGSWVGVRSGVAFNLIAGLTSIANPMGWLDHFVTTLIPATSLYPSLRWFLGGVLVMTVWAGVLAILICVDMEGLDFEDGG